MAAEDDPSKHGSLVGRDRVGGGDRGSSASDPAGAELRMPRAACIWCCVSEAEIFGLLELDELALLL